jgi:hypothetical protein
MAPRRGGPYYLSFSDLESLIANFCALDRIVNFGDSLIMAASIVILPASESTDPSALSGHGGETIHAIKWRLLDQT